MRRSSSTSPTAGPGARRRVTRRGWTPPACSPIAGRPSCSPPLLEGNRRFGDLQDRLGSISPVTLTDRLAYFIDNGMLVRTPIVDGARRQEYRTTPKSLDFFPVFAALNAWAARHLSENGRSGLTIVHSAGEHLLEPQYTCNACNAVLRRADTDFVTSTAGR